MKTNQTISNQKMRVWPTLLAVSLAAAAPASASLIHEYSLNGTFFDSLGGPSLTELVPGSGVLGVSAYSFAQNQGLILQNALPDPGNYSILMDFSFDTISGYRRILDFKNRATDRGFYNLDGGLTFYPVIGGPNVIAAGVPARVVLTRDSATSSVTAYVDGQPQFTFLDSANDGIFDQPNALLHFFTDDLAVPNEASPGVVDEIAIYDSAITAAGVLSLGGPGGGLLPTPEPTSAVLLGLGTLLLAARRRRSAQA